ncbi:hypothetical protein [Salinirarus marinus]|uniref:hypothetical protein n=1 Tax=Salinirarus marinus TaxID=3068310 RepID=UPI003C6C3E30
MPTRRTLLRAGVLSTLGLAGCLAADGSGTPTATGTPTGTPTRSPTTARPTYRPSTVSLHLEPVSVPDVAEAAVETFDDLSRSQRDALDEIRETGAYTVTNVVRSDRLPFASEPFVRLGGEFFRVERETLAQRPRTVHRFHVEVLSRTQGEGVPFSELSSRDRAVFRAGLTEEYRQRGTPFAGTFLYTFENRSVAAESRFVTEKTVTVDYEDDVFEVTFQRIDEVTELDVRYALSHVADGADAFRDHLRSAYVRTVSSLSLSAAQRELLRRAIRESRYEEDRPLSAAFSGLLDTLETLPAVPNAGRYVRDGDAIYHVWKTAVEV